MLQNDMRQPLLTQDTRTALLMTTEMAYDSSMLRNAFQDESLGAYQLGAQQIPCWALSTADPLLTVLITSRSSQIEIKDLAHNGHNCTS